jgi:hypothetical protein
MERINVIKLQYVGWHPPEIFWIEHQEKGSQFLCKKEDSIFLSTIGKSETLNYYVDHKDQRVCIPISELDEIYLLTEGKL